MCLQYENLSLRGILIQIIKEHSSYKSFIAKAIDGNTLK